MIVGLGSDLVDIRRIEGSLDRFGSRFIERLFTETERAASERRHGAARAAAYAKRFAAKEAAAKALGTGFAEGLGWRDIEVTNLASGAPRLGLSGGALPLLARLIPAGHHPWLHVSLSDDYPLAQATVIISAEPEPQRLTASDA